MEATCIQTTTIGMNKWIQIQMNKGVEELIPVLNDWRNEYV